MILLNAKWNSAQLGKRSKWMIACLVAVLSMSACVAPAPPAVPSPTNIPTIATNTATPVKTETPTIAPTDTSAPTSTPPSPTETPEPTSTLTPTPTETPVPEGVNLQIDQEGVIFYIAEDGAKHEAPVFDDWDVNVITVTEEALSQISVFLKNRPALMNETIVLYTEKGIDDSQKQEAVRAIWWPDTMGVVDAEGNITSKDMLAVTAVGLRSRGWAEPSLDDVVFPFDATRAMKSGDRDGQRVLLHDAKGRPITYTKDGQPFDTHLFFRLPFGTASAISVDAHNKMGFEKRYNSNGPVTHISLGGVYGIDTHFLDDMELSIMVVGKLSPEKGQLPPLGTSIGRVGRSAEPGSNVHNMFSKYFQGLKTFGTFSGQMIFVAAAICDADLGCKLAPITIDEQLISVNPHTLVSVLTNN